jgi:hypothetical protein
LSILADFEDRLGGAIEGMFSGLFKSPVQPAELARAASKEMARSRKLGVDKVYVANVYSVFISVRDAETLGGLVATLEGELETYLLAYAREHDYNLATRPVVRFATDGDLRLGRFEVIGQQMSVAEIYEEIGSVLGVTDDLDAAPVVVPGAGVAGVGSAAVGSVPQNAPLPAGAGETDTPRSDISDSPDLLADRTGYIPYDADEAAVEVEPVTVALGQATLEVPGYGVMTLEPARAYVMGRQRGCDVFIEDANSSREHARLAYDGRNWVLDDLHSTNGTFVEGRRVASAPLRSGDHITIGISDLVFRMSGGRA